MAWLGMGVGLGHRGGAFNPATLFTSGEKGFIYDFTDSAKLFSDASRTTPITPGGTIKGVTDLSGNGAHGVESIVLDTGGPSWTAGVALNSGTKSLSAGVINFSGTSTMTVIVCVKPTATTSGKAFIHNTPAAAPAAAVGLSGALGFLAYSTLIGSAGTAERLNTRGTNALAFQVWTGAFDYAGATGADEIDCRVNGELYGDGVSAAGPAGVGPFSASADNRVMSGHIGTEGFAGSMARIIVIGRLLTATELFNAEYWCGQGGGLALISEIPPAGASYYSLLESYGQSLSVGATSTPVLSTATRYNDKMFNAGVNNPATRTSLVAMVEATRTLSAVSCGETPASGMAELLHERGYGAPFIGVADGFPATTIAQLSQGQAPYNLLLASATQGWRRSREEYRHFKSRAISWMQGESDGGNTSYAANLNTLRGTLNTDIKAVTLQTEDVWLLTYQLDRPQIGLAHLSASDTYGNIRVAFPSYFLAHDADTIHLSNVGSKVAGAYFGLAYKAIIEGGNTTWQPLKATAATRNGVNVDLTYNASTQLVVDTTIVAAQTNYGYRLFQSDGVTEIAITGVTLVGLSTVRLATGAAVPAGAIVKVGGWSDATSHAVASCKTNIRDSQGSTIVFDGGGLNYAMHNWALAPQQITAA